MFHHCINEETTGFPLLVNDADQIVQEMIVLDQAHALDMDCTATALQQQRKITAYKTNPSWNIPRGGQQQPPPPPPNSTLGKYSTALFDGSILSSATATAAATATTISSPFLQYNIVIFLV